MRELDNAEISAAEMVFENTVDCDIVRIADDYGFGERPWCSPPVPFVLPYFVLHVGPSSFDRCLSESSLFIHEMAHVWQGVHNIPYWYVLNSACNQVLAEATTGNYGAAYSVSSSDQKQFKEYGVEQQANIVGGWFASGASAFDWRFRYIDRNIRRGDPMALSQPIVPPHFNIIMSRRSPAWSRTTLRRR